MDLASAPNGPVCRKCKYQGPMPEASMDRINEIRKRSARMPAATSKAPVGGPNTPSAQELAERLKALKGKSTEEAEFL